MNRCSECGRLVGRILDVKGVPIPYWCPNKGRMAQPQSLVVGENRLPDIVIGERL